MTEHQLVLRVELLERRNRTLQRWLAALSIVAAALVSMAQMGPIPGEIRARRFVLVTDRGEIRGEFTTWGELPMLSLRDAAGNPLIRFTGNSTGGAVLEYRDAAGQVQDLAAPMGAKPLTRRPN